MPASETQKNWDIGFGTDLDFGLEDGLRALLGYSFLENDEGKGGVKFEYKIVYDFLGIPEGSVISMDEIRLLVKGMSDATIDGPGNPYPPLIQEVLIKIFTDNQLAKAISGDGTANTDPSKAKRMHVRFSFPRAPHGTNVLSSPLFHTYADIDSLYNVSDLPKRLWHKIPGINSKIKSQTYEVSPDGKHIRLLDPNVVEIIGSEVVSISELERALNKLSEIIEKRHGVGIQTLENLSAAYREAIKRENRLKGPIRKIAQLATKFALGPDRITAASRGWYPSKTRAR